MYTRAYSFAEYHKTIQYGPYFANFFKLGTLVKGASRFNVNEIARQVNGNIEKQFVQRVLDEMFMPSTKTMLK